MDAADEAVRRKVAEHIAKDGDSLEFTKFFWKGCEPLPRDFDHYSKFAKIVADAAKGIRPYPMKMGVGLGTSHSWAVQDAMPKLGHYLRAFVRLGTPVEGKVWLTMECTHGYANPIGKFLQVPVRIESWADVEKVLEQIEPIGPLSPEFTKAYIFGFLVGILIGDAHKPKHGRGHRNIHLVLSKKYETNVKIGDFSTFCAQQMGLRMARGEDIPKPENKPHGFYAWVSQSSPFIDWVFNVVLGLNDGQHTTYDQVVMNWVSGAPKDFRLGLIHGIAESDGSVAVASQTVEFWVIPDWEFMIGLLATFGLKAFRNREAVSLVKSQAIESFKVPVFTPHLRTFRYKRLELLATTPKLGKKDRIPADVRSEVMRLATEGVSVPSIVVEIAESKRLLISFEAAQRWAMKTGKYNPKSAGRESSEKSA